MALLQITVIKLVILEELGILLPNSNRTIKGFPPLFACVNVLDILPLKCCNAYQVEAIDSHIVFSIGLQIIFKDEGAGLNL